MRPAAYWIACGILTIALASGCGRKPLASINPTMVTSTAQAVRPKSTRRVMATNMVKRKKAMSMEKAKTRGSHLRRAVGSN